MLWNPEKRWVTLAGEDFLESSREDSLEEETFDPRFKVWVGI